MRTTQAHGLPSKARRCPSASSSAWLAARRGKTSRPDPSPSRQIAPAHPEVLPGERPLLPAGRCRARIVVQLRSGTRLLSARGAGPVPASPAAVSHQRPPHRRMAAEAAVRRREPRTWLVCTLLRSPRLT